ncbi:hypothetical protein [Massilia sp. CT11-137]|uniref:hypothetical protein n=1 Tax=Massilia sp. CT11-137 TaxID=3393901 RepID=UPI0039A4286F
MNLVDAVRRRHLVQWHDRGFVRTIEPYLFVVLRGLRLALIARQIAGGPADGEQPCWKVIDAGEGLNVDSERTFGGCEQVPTHLLGLVHMVYASPSVESEPTPVERR